MVWDAMCEFIDGKYGLRYGLRYGEGNVIDGSSMYLKVRFQMRVQSPYVENVILVDVLVACLRETYYFPELSEITHHVFIYCT